MVRLHRLAAAAALVFSTSSAVPQVRGIDSATVLKQSISDLQVRQLSRAIEKRSAARSLVVNPDAVREKVDTQAASVDVAGQELVPTEPAPHPEVAPAIDQPAPTPVRTRVEFIRTSAADEVLLTKAIAAHDALKPALSLDQSSLITLPGVVRMTGEPGSELQLKPFILVNQPLQRTAEGLFEGELLIGVTEIIDTGLVRQLPTPLLFQIVGAHRSNPSDVLVNTTSPPFQRVRVVLRNVEDKAAQLLIVSVIDRQGTKISLPVEGQLSIETDSGSIEGLGLAKTPIHVSLNGVDKPAGKRVLLHVEPSGFLEPSVVRLDENGNGTAELRSDSVGTAKIRATVAGYEPATTTIQFRMPYLTFTAAILGGLIGAFISFATAPRRKRSGTAIRLVGAALFGVLIFVLYVVGINVLPISPKVTVGAAFVFAVSAFAAWLGPTISNWPKKLPVARAT